MIGNQPQFTTRELTLEFKNNLDALIDNVDDTESKKSFKHIDICVCWGAISSDFPGYVLEEVTGANIDERKYPGVTHMLHKDGDTHIIQVIMLQTVTGMITAGALSL